MSGAKKRAATEHSELMRQMGSRNGSWNPAAPDQDLAFLRPEIRLSPRAHQALSWIKWKTTDQRDGARTATPYTCDERGKLTLIHMALDLGWVAKRNADLSNASKVVSELETAGFCRRNEEGVFWLCAEVGGMHSTAADEGAEDPQIDEDEEMRWWCTYHLPEYVLESFQQLSKEGQKLFRTEWTRSDEWKKTAISDATFLIRERTTERQNELCRKMLGTSLKSGVKTRDREAPLAVTLNFDGGDVQTSSNGYVHGENDGVYNAESGSAQTTPSFIGSLHVDLDPSSSSFSVLADDDDEAPLDPVREALTQYGTPDAQVIAQIRAECRRRTPDATDEEIVAEIHNKAPLAKHNRIGFLLTAVPLVFIDYRKTRRRPAARQETPVEVDQSKFREWEAILADPEASDAEKNAARRCLGVDAMKAGQA